MLLMFAEGFGSTGWMAALTGVMVYEAVGRHGRRLSTAVGIILLLVALSVLSAPLPAGLRDPSAELLAHDQSLHHAEEAPLEMLDGEPVLGDVIERVAQQVVSLEPDGERLHHVLGEPDREVRAAGVLEGDDPTARTQHSDRLGDRARVVRDRAQDEAERDRIARLVRERQGGRVAEPRSACLPAAAARAMAIRSIASLSSIPVNLTVSGYQRSVRPVPTPTSSVSTRASDASQARPSPMTRPPSPDVRSYRSAVRS
jgi:hypothetical protein